MRAPRLPRPDVVLLATLAGALLLRVWGLAYGLPHVYNPDEVAILSRALSLADKGLNPGNFVYPSLYFYLLAGVVALTYAAQSAIGAVGTIDEFQRRFWADPSAVYLAGRMLSAAAGVGTVAVTYVLARAAGTRVTGRIAAICMAVAYFPVRDAHMIKHDVLATLLFALTVAQARVIWTRGRRRDFAIGGALAGATLAFHYYGAVAVIPIVAAAWLRAGGLRGLLRERGAAIATILWAVTFVVLSPYVVLDFSTAARDIAQNRAIIVDRARETFGVIGAGWEQLRLMVTQGAGAPMLLAAAAGAIVLLRREWRTGVWLLAFPAAFALFLTQTWPYGRLQNPLYPFIAIAAAIGIEAIAGRRGTGAAARWRTPLVILATAICVAQPLWHSVLLDRLMTREDTRTSARRWIEANVPAGTGIAVQPYSVPLEVDPAWWRATLAAQAPAEPIGSRARGLLNRSPYPAPAYAVTFIGEGGLDRDKRYVSRDEVLSAPGVRALRQAGISHVVLNRMSSTEIDPLRDRITAEATLVYRAWPFAAEHTTSPAQLPDHDIRPTAGTLAPGPIVEIWRLTPRSDGR